MDICDANFVGEFNMVEFGNIFIGSYPESHSEYDQIHQKNIKHILNLSSKALHDPKLSITDYQIAGDWQNLIPAVLSLSSLSGTSGTSSTTKTLICCTSGTTSSPTVLAAYLCGVQGQSLSEVRNVM
jgi:hypothetical protein